jgi:hypothetical protein
MGERKYYEAAIAFRSIGRMSELFPKKLYT